MNKQGYIYIITNQNNSVLYTGVTSNLKQRIYQHKQGEIPGFSQKYKVNKLVYYEVADDMYNAITREKQIKKGSRTFKIKLIVSMDPEWSNLYNKI